MDKWGLLKAYVLGMCDSAEVSGVTAIEGALTKVAIKMNDLENAEKEAYDKLLNKQE